MTDTAPTPPHVDDLATDATDHTATDHAATDDVGVTVGSGSSSGEVLESAMATIEEGESLIVDVEVALERLEAGQYRTCEICGAPLDAAALVSAPTLRRCVVHAG